MALSYVKVRAAQPEVVPPNGKTGKIGRAHV